MKTKETLTLRIINNPGLLIRIALLLERRDYTLESMSLKHFVGYSEMYLIVLGAPEKFEQIQKQLIKLIDIIEVQAGIREERKWSSTVQKTTVLA